MVKLPRSLTRVTFFSKTLAALLFIIFFTAFLYAGLAFYQRYTNLEGNISPTPTPSLEDKTSCTSDIDCVLVPSDMRRYCCPNTYCMYYADNDVIAVNDQWFSRRESAICGNGTACPMYAVLCPRTMTEENNHYAPKCVQHVCTKVKS